MKPPFRIALLIALALSFGALSYLAIATHVLDKDAFSTAGTVATLIVVAWYTWETQKLRESAEAQVNAANDQVTVANAQLAVSSRHLKASQDQLGESQRQFELAQRQLAESQIQTENANTPIVMAHFELNRSPHESRDEMVFHNIGTAPAFSVTVEPGLSGTFRIGILGAAVVRSGAMVKTKMSLLNSGGKPYRSCATLNELVNQWRDCNITESFALKIIYSRADGERYETECRVAVPFKYESFEFLAFRKVS